MDQNVAAVARNTGAELMLRSMRIWLNIAALEEVDGNKPAAKLAGETAARRLELAIRVQA